MRNTAFMLAGALALLPLTAAIAADGDVTMPGHPTWARWQGRLSLGVADTPWRLGADAPPARLSHASLMGDYFFGQSLTGTGLLGGFRATSGIVFGSRAMPSTGQANLASGNSFSISSRTFGQTAPLNAIDPNGDTVTQPYLGFGYTGLSVRNGLSFSADLGLLARGASTGRAALASQTLDDQIRQMRMTPLFQLGVSYSF